MTDQRQDVTGAFAQRLEHQADHVQTVIEVFAKMPGIDGFFQLHVGGRQHPHIDLDALARTQPDHLALL
ncbi:hypothetical protein D3C80_2107360 [compost metagenome]